MMIEECPECGSRNCFKVHEVVVTPFKRRSVVVIECLECGALL